LKKYEEIYHPSVLLKESIEGLKIDKAKLGLDCTLGGAGHTVAFLKANPHLKMIALDQDEDVIEIAKKRLEKENLLDRVSIYYANFKDFDLVLKEEKVDKVDFIFFDLGVSHFQLRSDRGFSFWEDMPLDMRMDKNLKKNASDIVNTYKEKDLIKIFKEYGEEKYAPLIAKEIIRYRGKKKIESTLELSKIIEKVYLSKYLKKKNISEKDLEKYKDKYKKIFGKHPSTRVFQALRIEVNKEFDSLKEALNKVSNHLSPGGRLGIITFHSLEDKIVKNTLKGIKDLKLIDIYYPSKEEIEKNIASRSAKLRIYEKI